MGKVRFEGLEYTVFGLELEKEGQAKKYVAVRSPFRAGNASYDRRTLTESDLREIAGRITVDADELLGRRGYRYLEVQLSFNPPFASKITEQEIYTSFRLTAEEQKAMPHLIQHEYKGLTEVIPRLLAERQARR